MPGEAFEMGMEDLIGGILAWHPALSQCPDYLSRGHRTHSLDVGCHLLGQSVKLGVAHLSDLSHCF
jgi:hypothetical protein